MEMVTKEKVLERFQQTLSKVAVDQKLADAVRDKTVLEMLFSNNLRELAKVDIAQNELIVELHQDIQDAFSLIIKGELVAKDLIGQVDALRQSHEDIVKEFGEKFVDVFSVLVKEHEELRRTNRGVQINAGRIDSGVCATRCVVDIKELSRKCRDLLLGERIAPEEVLSRIVKLVKTNFADVVLRHDDKRMIMCAVAESGFADVKVGVADGLQIPMGQALERELNAFADEAMRYRFLKEKLIGIIDGFSAQGVNADPTGMCIPELLKVKKNLNENSFDVALVGEFQGGKSTTFNVLCGGREISPRGLNGGGIRTSSAVIFAQNIDGDEAKDGLSEWAEIAWLSKEEILNRIKCVLRSPGENPEDISEDSIEGRLHQKWASKTEGSNELLRIATLQYRVLTSGGYERESQKLIFPIDGFQHLVQFPDKWEERWLNGEDANFAVDESLFTCLDSVLVRLHSSLLASIGCRIIDCPGLFASPWDTERARAVMLQANAIWYLLGGEREIGDNDRRALQKIKDLELEDKCFFSINFRRSLREIERIVEADKACLRGPGLEFDSGAIRIWPYNAYLAFRAEQLKLASSRGLSSRDVSCLIEEYEECAGNKNNQTELENSVSKCIAAIKELCVPKLYALGQRALARELDAEEVDVGECGSKLKDYSRIKDVSSAVNTHVITRRGYSILVTHGTHECKKALNVLDQSLKRKIQAAEKKLEEAKNRAESAKNDFKRFKEDFKEKFSFLSLDLTDSRLTEEFFNEYGSEIKQEMVSRAKAICKKKWKEWHWDSKDVNKESEDAIANLLVGLINDKLSAFVKPEKLCKSSVFATHILKPTQAKLEMVQEEWQALAKKHQLCNQNYKFTADSDVESIAAFKNALHGKIDLPWYSWELLKDVITLGSRRLWQTPEDRIDELFVSDDNPVAVAFERFQGNDRNRSEVREFLGRPRSEYCKKIFAKLDEMEKDLDRNIEDEEDALMKSAADKKKEAKAAETVRNKVVIPTRDKIAELENEVNNLYRKM